MLVNAVNQQTEIEDAAWIEEIAEKKPLKRRIVVTSLLAIAAIGAHYLHGHVMPPSQSTASQAAAIACAADVRGDSTAAVAGPNSLFGDVSTNRILDTPITGEWGSNELDVASLNDHGGVAGIASPLLDATDSPSLKQFDASDTSVAAAGVLGAVPEPSTAGILLLSLAPVIGLRRPRQRPLA
jgi:hypothetical protein